jgi:uncharacterized protein (TIGR00661 family)
MGRICYGVMGDARGHVSRALAIARELAHHEILFIGGGKIQILKENGYPVQEVPVLPTIIRNNRVDFAATLAHGIMGLGRMAPAIKKVMKLIQEFDPHLIISDYEFVTFRAAQLLGRPCISLDNQHLLTHCRYDPLPGQHFNRYLTCSLIRYLFSCASHYLITSFHTLPPVDQALTEVFPPLIKQKLLEYRPAAGDHALVYVRGNNFAGLFRHIKQTGRKFIVYGLGARPPDGNLFFKKTSEDDFLADLASSNYVIASGGHSLISEALYLGKPILCLPVRFFYEQFFNAYFLAQNGFGNYVLNLADGQNFLKVFENRVDHYRAQIKRHNFLGNKLIGARLEELYRGQTLGLE